MPAKTEKQRKFFGAVLSEKEGKGKFSKEVKKVAKEMSKEEIKKFTKKKKQ